MKKQSRFDYQPDDYLYWNLKSVFGYIRTE